MGKTSVEDLIEKNELIWKKRETGWIPYTREFAPDSPSRPYPTIWNDLDTTRQTKAHQKTLFGEDVFDTPKPVELIERCLRIATRAKEGDLVLDFFAGASTTAHAVMKINAEDGGDRRFIMVQLPELCDEKTEAFIKGYENIADISKERIRLAGKVITEGESQSDSANDVGFRVLKIDTSNMEDVYYIIALS